jgi:hypothetical protein
MNVTAAPRPTRKRPTKSGAGVAASAMPSEPNPITALPAAITRRGPKPSIATPAGTMKPA